MTGLGVLGTNGLGSFVLTGKVFTGQLALLSCSDPVGMEGFSAFVGGFSPLFSVPGCCSSVAGLVLKAFNLTLIVS